MRNRDRPMACAVRMKSLPEHGQHRGARHAGQRRQHEQRHGEGRQHQLAESGPPAAPIARRGEVDQVEAGDVGRRRGEDVDARRRVGRPAQQIVEGIDQQQPRHEGRHADSQRAEQPHGVVDHRALAQGGEDAERHGEDQRDDQRRAGELQRGRQTAPDVEHDRLAGGHRPAEIAAARSRPGSARAARGSACRAPCCGAIPRSPPVRRRGRRRRRSPDRPAARASG